MSWKLAVLGGVPLVAILAGLYYLQKPQEEFTATNFTSIDVIAYQGKYLPIDQLVIEDEEACGARHYHAPNGTVTATDGTTVKDPGPNCGFGKVSEFSVEGLELEQQPIEYRNGSESTHVRKMSGLTKFINIVFKRGTTGDVTFWNWIIGNND